MMNQHGQDIRDAAVAWHIRLQDADEGAWLQFTEWLEADPRHDAAYDEVAMLDGRIAMAIDAIPAKSAANDDHATIAQPREVRRWLFPIAAALVALLLGGLFVYTMNPASGIYTVATGPGETRMVEIPGGGRIAMNGDTLLTLDRDNPRKVALERGEAEFHVVHNAGEPFSVRLGEHEVVDVGTIFDIVRDDRGLSVQVGEGAVTLNPTREAVNLAAGDAAFVAKGSAAIIRTKVSPDGVGGWRRGRLDYRDAPVALVATDLSRALGVPVSVGAGLDNVHFTGTIKLGKDRALLMKQVQALLGVDAKPLAKGWQLSPHDQTLR